MLLLFYAAGAFVMTMGLGAICCSIHFYSRRKHGNGSWLLYGLIAGAVATALIAQGWMNFSVPSQSPPTGEDYQRILKAFVMWGAAPGTGLIAGLLALFKPAPPTTLSTSPEEPAP